MIEGLRTDQLIAPVVNIPVSQIVSVVLAITGIIIVITGRRRCARKEIQQTEK